MRVCVCVCVRVFIPPFKVGYDTRLISNGRKTNFNLAFFPAPRLFA